MRPEHKKTVERQVLPNLSEVQTLIGEVAPILKKLRRDGQGVDMSKMTFAINDLTEAAAKVEATMEFLKEILERKEEPR